MSETVEMGMCDGGVAQVMNDAHLSCICAMHCGTMSTTLTLPLPLSTVHTHTHTHTHEHSSLTRPPTSTAPTAAAFCFFLASPPGLAL